MERLAIERYVDGEWCILRLAGNVDMNTFPLLEAALFAEVESKTIKLKVDCEHLRAINSAGFGLLLAVYRQMRQQGGRLLIDRMDSKTANLFNLLGFLRLADDGDDYSPGVLAR